MEEKLFYVDVVDNELVVKEGPIPEGRFVKGKKEWYDKIKVSAKTAELIFQHDLIADYQRDMDSKLAKSYSDSMEADVWNEEATDLVEFDIDGKNGNGQHRLKAISLSPDKNKTIRFPILLNVPYEAIAFRDAGKKRNRTDTINMANSLHELSTGKGFLKYPLKTNQITIWTCIEEYFTEKPFAATQLSHCTKHNELFINCLNETTCGKKELKAVIAAITFARMCNKTNKLKEIQDFEIRQTIPQYEGYYASIKDFLKHTRKTKIFLRTLKFIYAVQANIPYDMNLDEKSYFNFNFFG